MGSLPKGIVIESGKASGEILRGCNMLDEIPGECSRKSLEKVDPTKKVALQK